VRRESLFYQERPGVGKDISVELIRVNEWVFERGEGDSLRTTFTLELRMDLEGGEQRAIINEALRNAAQMLYAQAVMLSNKRPPQIALRSDNSFEGTDVLDLHVDDDGA
jgi:hypothetical protein